MKILFLQWDSSFFDRAVAKIDVSQNEEIDFIQVIDDCKKKNYKLIYIFINSLNQKMVSKATALFGKPINEKIFLEKKGFNHEFGKTAFHSTYNIELIGVNITKDDYNQILNLTISAGAFSRFKLDEQLGTKKFIEMYTFWVNSLINNKDYRILVIKDIAEKIIGFLSYKIIENGYKIDFMSIDETYQKKGLGKALLQSMYQELGTSRFDYIVTEIHLGNTAINKFFTSHGFTFKEASNIYHVHL